MDIREMSMSHREKWGRVGRALWARTVIYYDVV